MNSETNKELYHSLKRLNRFMHRVGHHGMVHRGQAYLLKTIQQNDGIVQRDLAELLDIRPSSLTEFLVKMEHDGLVERKQDDHDQRLLHIHLTGQGQEVLASFTENEDSAYDSLFSCLTAEESSAMVTICNKLCDNLESQHSGEEGCRHHDHKFHHHSHDDCENRQDAQHLHHDEHHDDCKCHDGHHNEHHVHHDCKGHGEHHDEHHDCKSHGEHHDEHHDCKGHGEHHGHHCCKGNNEINPQPEDSSKPE